MNILSIKPPHDGSIVLLQDDRLIFAIEGEKDSNPRYAGVNLTASLNALQRLDELPDVIVCGDDCIITNFQLTPYYGYEEPIKRVEEIKIAGKNIKRFYSSHERAHIFCSYGMSPYPQGEPCYALCWEGGIGRFYYIGPDMLIQGYEGVLWNPGMRYIFPYLVADTKEKDKYSIWDMGMAGKMMALTGYGKRDEATKNRWSLILKEWIDYSLLDGDDENHHQETVKYFRQFPINLIGVEHQDFKDCAYHYSEAIFDKFYQFAKANLNEKLPLLISGGCGLNCDWNKKWKDSGLFSDVFVPPCANDSGSAIGYAIDGMHHFTGNAKIKWSVYAGEEFINDALPGPEYIVKPLNYKELVNLLTHGLIFAWVQGKYEIGPRALCNRSLIAAPFLSSMQQRLNRIKQRENFRPIAPACTEESVSRYFDWQGESPYMLYFMEVKTPHLQAVTHVDNSARAQTVRRDQNEKMYDLLKEFEVKTGYPVLCNTSLNFKEKGFINHMSDLIRYVSENDVDGMVVGDNLYVKKGVLYKLN